MHLTFTSSPLLDGDLLYIILVQLIRLRGVCWSIGTGVESPVRIILYAFRTQNIEFEFVLVAYLS